MTVPPGCLTAGAPPADHTIRTMLSICLHLLWESESARTTAPSDMAFSHYQMCLRPTPPTPPDHWSAPAPPLAAPESSASATSHPKLPVLRPRRFGAAPTQGQYIRNPPRTGTSPSRRGERYHHTHSRLHPASRAQTLIRSSGVMRVPSSAPQPAAAPLHPPHPSPSTTATVIRQQGLLVRVP